ncbi:MAG: glutaredoxin domain-containing protein [Promethearchaeia archaeon]
MTEIKLPWVITKEDCHRCHELKEWLKENEVQYVEKSVDDEELIHQLLHDESFVTTFCDEEGCLVNTPVVMHNGKYWFKELWGINGLREKKAKELFDVE